MNKELKRTILAIILFAHMTEEVLEDGKVKFREIIESIDEGKELFNSLKDFQLLVGQYRTLTTAGKLAMVQELRNELDFTNDKIEKFIEKGIALLISIEIFIKEVKTK